MADQKYMIDELQVDVERLTAERDGAFAKMKQLSDALRPAREKLKIYRSMTDGQYGGGMEYTVLMRLIEDALDR